MIFTIKVSPQTTCALAELEPGRGGRIVAPSSPDATPSPRLRELGFLPGTPVRVLRRGPLGDPVEVELRGFRVCVRRADLAAIRVEVADAG